jgi:DNA polymerase III, delta subunit
LKFVEMKSSLKNEGIQCVYLLEGEDAYFRESGLSLLRELVAQPELNYAVWEGDAALSDLPGFLSALASFPFLSEKRVVAVREFYPRADVFKGAFGAYLKDPYPDTVLAISNAKECAALRKQPNVVLVDCKKADLAVLTEWVMRTVRRSALAISQATAERICEYSLRDMTKIANETDKLVQYARGRGEVTEQDVRSLVVRDTEYQIYEMTERIGRKDVAGALAVLSEMQAKGETPQRLLASLYNYLRRLLHVSISRESDGALAGKLGIKEYAVKKCREQAARFKRKTLKRAVDRLADYDYAAKTGGIAFDDALFAGIFHIMVEG